MLNGRGVPPRSGGSDTVAEPDPATLARSGFTMIELIVILVILASMSAIVVPQVLGRLTTGEAATIAQTLSRLRSAVTEFRRDVLQYPSHVAHLTTLPPASGPDVCGNPYSSINRWRGPYLDRSVSTAGLKIGASTVQNGIRRTPANLTSGVYGTLFLDVRDVDQIVAGTVNEAMDGDAVLTSGTITWVAAGGTPTRGTLSLGIPVRGC